MLADLHLLFRMRHLSMKSIYEYCWGIAIVCIWKCFCVLLAQFVNIHCHIRAFVEALLVIPVNNAWYLYVLLGLLVNVTLQAVSWPASFWYSTERKTSQLSAVCPLRSSVFDVSNFYLSGTIFLPVASYFTIPFFCFLFFNNWNNRLLTVFITYNMSLLFVKSVSVLEGCCCCCCSCCCCSCCF